MRAHLSDLAQLVAKIFEGEIVFAELAFQLARLFQVDGFLDALDQAEHVAHAEDARHDAFRQKWFERIVLFADADELYRRAGDFANGKRSAAAGVAIHLGEDHAGDAEALVKFAGGADRVLTDHGVSDEEQLGRIQFVLQVGEFFHQLVVDVQAAGGVDQDHVAGGQFRFAHGAAHDFERLVGAGAGPDRSAGGFGDLRELLAGRGTVYVGGNDQRTMAMFAQPLAHFSGRGGFARTLQADNHPDRRRLGGILRLGFACRGVRPVRRGRFSRLAGRAKVAAALRSRRLCRGRGR